MTWWCNEKHRSKAAIRNSIFKTNMMTIENASEKVMTF